MEYRIEQVAAGNNWRVLGPGMLVSDPTWSLEDASRIATMLNRARLAFESELTGATVGLSKITNRPSTRAKPPGKPCDGCEIYFIT